MTKFKIGDRVRIVKAVFDDGESRGSSAQAFVGKTFDITKIDSDGQVQYEDYCWDDYELELVGGAMKYKQGDVLTTGSSERKVLGICGDAYIMSIIGGFDTGGSIFTQGELDRGGFTLVTNGSEPRELTIDEIAEKFGLDPEQVRIKKES